MAMRHVIDFRNFLRLWMLQLRARLLTKAILYHYRTVLVRCVWLPPQGEDYVYGFATCVLKIRLLHVRFLVARRRTRLMNARRYR
jgi:hypothetical protein